MCCIHYISNNSGHFNLNFISKCQLYNCLGSYQSEINRNAVLVFLNNFIDSDIYDFKFEIDGVFDDWENFESQSLYEFLIGGEFYE